MNRAVFESPHTLDEIIKILEVLDNRTVFSDKTIHLQSDRLVKPLLDEFLPLRQFMRLCPDSRGRLSPHSNDGPDAIVTHPDGSETTIQIVVSHRSQSEAYGREMLAEGRVVFPARRRERVNGKIEETGRALQAPASRVAAVVTQVQAAFQKKVKRFQGGSKADVLLIYGQMSLVDESWKLRVREHFDKAESIPFARIVVCDQNGVHIDYTKCEP